MKQHITIDDLMDLTEEQEQNLRKLWVPKERDLAVAYICSNAEANEFEAIEFTVGRVELQERPFCVTLRSLQLIDESFYEELDRADDSVEELELEYQTPEDYFNLTDCLPLLSIGQMMEMLRNSYFRDSDFVIAYSRQQDKFQIGDRADIYDNQYDDGNSTELCDILWSEVKSML